MGVTRLKRKDRKNKARANNRVAKIKQLLSTPVIKNVDVEELKLKFNKGEEGEQGQKATGAPAPQTSAPKAPEAPTAAEAPSSPTAAEVPSSPTAIESPAAGIPDAPATATAPVVTPSKEEVFDAQEAARAKQAADEAEALVPGEVESPGEQFVRNQLADTTSNVQDKDIEAIKKVEEDEADTTPNV